MIGPNEAGIRECCGVKLWKLGPGPHPDVEGLWKVRKVSIAEKQIDIEGQVHTADGVKQYQLGVKIRVMNTKAALIARIYRAEDNDKSNMENSQAEEQVTLLLKRNARKLFEDTPTADNVESNLQPKSEEDAEGYGYQIVSVLVSELVIRPLSEVAQAIKDSGPNNPGVGSNAVPGLVPDLVVHEGGSA
ncbi:MAG: SPFH domain-containing protein [Candidatus Saccharibacteria bacterium]